MPVVVPEHVRTANFGSVEKFDEWRRIYGVDLSALRAAAANTSPVQFVLPQDAREWVRACEPLELARFDVRSSPLDSGVTSSATAQVTQNCEPNGVMLSFELKLDSQESLNINPDAVADGNHWHVPVWMISEPCLLSRGERVEARFERSTGCEHCLMRRVP
jgi:hypothetical protein